MGEQITVNINSFIEDFNLIERALSWGKLSGYENKSCDEIVELYLASKRGG
jgi:hypothetical protein